METDEVDIQAIQFLTSEGGVLTSTLNADVTCTLPEGALTIGNKSYCRVSIQIIDIDPRIVHKFMGKDAHVSPIIVLEPVRRKFHKALRKTFPLPGHAGKKVERKHVRVLFSITGSGENSEWKDITSSVGEATVSRALETGRLVIDHVVTGRFAVVCCENSIIDIPATMSEMVKYCNDGGNCDGPHADLLHAAQTDDLKALQTCLATNGVDVNFANTAGQTALHVAAKEGHVDISRALLDNNADLTCLTKRGNAAIHLACYYGHKDLVELFIERGCDVNLPSKGSGFPPLYPAILEAHSDIVKLLVSKGASFTWTSQNGLSLVLLALFTTFDKEKTTALVRLLLEEVDLAQLTLSEDLKKTGFTSHGEALLHCVGARQTSKDLTSYTRSKLAGYSSKAMQEDLASCEETEGEFKTLLEAAKLADTDRVAVLAAKSGLVNKTTSRRVSCLHCACQFDRLPVINALLKAGADCNALTQGGFSCLYIAVSCGHSAVVKALLKAGAETDTLNSFGLSARQIAVENGNMYIDDVIKDYAIRNEFKKENEVQKSCQVPAKKDVDDKAVKRCCTML